jgi:hypothetical protein
MEPSQRQSLDERYHAFLLRVWRESVNGPWRASLQASINSERIGFTDLTQMLTHLLELLDEQDAARSQTATHSIPYESQADYSTESQTIT